MIRTQGRKIEELSSEVTLLRTEVTLLKDIVQNHCQSPEHVEPPPQAKTNGRFVPKIDCRPKEAILAECKELCSTHYARKNLYKLAKQDFVCEVIKLVYTDKRLRGRTVSKGDRPRVCKHRLHYIDGNYN
jgi:hypothetical protein